MWFLIKIIFLPITIMFYFMKYAPIFIWYLFKMYIALLNLFLYLIYWIFEKIVYIFYWLFGSINKNNYSTKVKSMPINYSNKNTSFSNNFNKIKKPKNKISWSEEQFEREADLWGLSKEDRRIAKEERMSPADFIEAEERDDDELFTDEWE